MSGTPAIRTRVTEAEFLALPESMDRIELLDGEVVVSPSPSDDHQRVVAALVTVLTVFAWAHPPMAVRSGPLDIRFGPERILQPDVLVVRAGIPRGATMPLAVVPDLCIEVMSARRSYDRIVKRHVYAEAGVPEYWVVDLEERRVEVYRGVDSVRTVDDVLTTELLPGFSLPLTRLWSEGDQLNPTIVHTPR